MPGARYVLGYHGCDAKLASSIAAGGPPLSASKNAYDWLGHGQYFWEDAPQRALRWAREHKGLGKIKTPGVLGAVIDLGHCLNLIDIDNGEVVRTAYLKLSRLVKKRGGTLPTNMGADFGARNLDCAVFEALHAFIKAGRGRPFDTVRAFFVEGKPLYEGAQIRALDHVQICVRNPASILGYFVPRKARR